MKWDYKLKFQIIWVKLHGPLRIIGWKISTKIVTASLTTPAIVTVTALVAEMRIYSVKTCKMKNNATALN